LNTNEASDPVKCFAVSKKLIGWRFVEGVNALDLVSYNITTCQVNIFLTVGTIAINNEP
jgi:hypothetical protein